MPALRSRSATSSSVRGRSLHQPLDAGRQAEGDDGVSSSDGEVSDGLSSRDGDACGQCENGVKAITRCTACNIFLCEHCTIAHTKSKTSREHPLVVLRGLVRHIADKAAGRLSAGGLPDPYGLLDDADAGMGSLGGKSAQALLDVTVVRAQHLPKMDMWGSCDGLVQVSFEDQSLALPTQVVRTKPIKNSFDPVFEETFTIQVPRVHKAGALTVNVFDWNITGNEDLVGQATISEEQVRKLLCGQQGRTSKLILSLQNDLGAAIKGHDKQNAQVELHVRPFIRFIGTRPYREWEQSRNHNNPRADDKSWNLPMRYEKPKSAAQQACKEQANVRAAVLQDLCHNSRFVHAQMWLMDNSTGELTYSGEHYTKPTFLLHNTGVDKKIAALDELNQASVAMKGDASAIESLALEQDDTQATNLVDFIANPEIFVSKRLNMVRDK